jgi:hypothetical protein
MKMRIQPLPASAAIQSKIGNRKSKIISLARLDPRRHGHRIVQSAICILPLLTAGCTLMSYTSPTGEHFSRTSLGANTSLHSLAFDASTNGLRRVEVRGYANDNTEALGSITEAAVRAAISSAK